MKKIGFSLLAIILTLTAIISPATVVWAAQPQPYLDVQIVEYNPIYISYWFTWQDVGAWGYKTTVVKNDTQIVADFETPLGQRTTAYNSLTLPFNYTGSGTYTIIITLLNNKGQPVKNVQSDNSSIIIP